MCRHGCVRGDIDIEEIDIENRYRGKQGQGLYRGRPRQKWQRR